MIELIYGQPGSGKTHYILECLKKDAAEGRRAFLIVPEQMTVSAERAVLSALPLSAQLSVEVLNFSRLANRVFRERGGLCYNYATNGIRKLIMWRTLREVFPLLKEYGFRAADDRTLADSMLSTLKELKAGGITPAMLDRAAEELNQSHSPLAGKISDLALVGSVYETLLSDRFSDTADDLPRLCAKLDEEPFFCGTNIYIDGFSSFTGQEHELIRRFFRQAENTYITLPISSGHDRAIDTKTAQECSVRLRRDASSFGGDVKLTSLPGNHRTDKPELRLIASGLWTAPQTEIPEADRGAVELRISRDIYDESEDCAARVRELMESGLRCREILIAARDASSYRGILDAALEKNKIPYFFSEKTDLSSSSLARLVLSALRIFLYGWKQSDVISHLKSGLFDIPVRDADLFECYCAKWSITGKRFTDEKDWTMNPRGYVDHMTERDAEILSAANQVKKTFSARLADYQYELENAGDTAGMCRATLAYLERLNVRESLRLLAARELETGHVREAQENARVYDAFLDALDGICDAFDGAEKPDLRTFAAALSIILEATELGSIPTSYDAVTIGSADMLRAESPRAVILLGCCDGKFPAAVSDSGLLSEDDRKVLKALSLSLTGSRSERSSDELFYFRRAAAYASEKLIVSTRSDAGPSIGFARFKLLFPYLKQQVIDTAADPFRRIRTPESAKDSLRLFRGSPLGTAAEDAVREYAAAHPDSGCIPFGTLSVPVSARYDRVDPAAAREAFGKRISISNTQIESFVKCRFMYYCRYVLRLEPWEKVRFSPMNKGTLIHFILEKYIREIAVRRGGMLPDPTEKKAMIEALIAEYAALQASSGTESSPARFTNTMRRIASYVPVILDDVMSDVIDGDFRPEMFEQKIGRDGIDPLSFRIPDGDAAGTEITIGGIIDRVDVWRHDGKAYLRAIDYKTGSSLPGFSDYSQGLNLQLYLYLFTMLYGNERQVSSLLGGTPSFGALAYRDVSTPVQSSENYRSEEEIFGYFRDNQKTKALISDDPDVRTALSRTGNSIPKKVEILAETEIESLYSDIRDTVVGIAREMTDGAAGAVPLTDGGQPCGHCPFSSVCRAAQKARS